MRKNSTYEEKRKAGFTLVELIVVLVMLSILTAVAVPTYMGYVDDNKAKQCETHRKALASRLEEMSAMGSTASLTEDEMNSAENGCPAGGKYTLEGSGNTIHCDKHGDTTVILKSTAGIVTADVNNVQTEAPKETATPTPDNSTPVEPVKSDFKIAISPESANMEMNAVQTVTASVVTEENCTASNIYNWTVPSNFEKIEDNGSSIKIKAVSAGTLCNISCSSSAAVAEGDPVSASASTQITVNEQKSLTVSLTPNSLELVLGEEGKEAGLLTANVAVSGYDSYVCEWTIEEGKEMVASVTKATDDQTKASVTGLSGGTATVTCTVTADNGAAMATATATVTVTVPQEDTVITYGDFEIDGIENEQVHWGGGDFTKFMPKNLPAGGVWSYAGNDNLVRFVNNAEIYIDDKYRQGVYPLRYTVGDQVYEMNAYVRYPIYGLDSAMPMDSNMYVNDGPKEISAKVHGWYSTATRNVVFTSSAPNVIEIVQGTERWERGSDNQGWNYVTVNAKSVGEATITMTVKDPTINRVEDEWSITRNIKVSNPNISIWISNIDNLKVEDERSINPQIQPSDISQYSLEYYDYNSEYISIADGKVTGLNQGKTEVKVRMKRGEEVLATGSFWVTVVSENDAGSTELSGIWLELKNEADLIINQPLSVSFAPDQSGDIIIHPNEDRASLDGYRINAVWGGKLGYENGLIVPKAVETTTLSIQITNGTKTPTGSIDVKVIDPYTLTGINILVQKKNSIMQGEKLSIAKWPNEGDIVIGPVPETATTEWEEYNIAEITSYPWDYLKRDGSSNDVIGGDTICKATLWIKMKNSANKEQVVSTGIEVVRDPSKPMPVQGNNVRFGAIEWDALRSAIQNGTVTDSDFPLSNLYYIPDETGNIPKVNEDSIVYVRKKDASLPWDDSCSVNMTFAEYYRSHKDLFYEVKINKYNIPGADWQDNGVPGKLWQISGMYYISIKPFPRDNLSSWDEGKLAEYFVKVPTI